MDFGKTRPSPTTAADASDNARFLHEIEALSQALYLRRPASTGRPRPAPAPAGTKKPAAAAASIWNWKPLRALSSHIRSRRFNCCFTLHAHSVLNLPPAFDGASLRVHWRRREGGAATRPATVVAGAAEFGESLSYSCGVYGSRSGPHHAAKYEAKLFLLYVSVASGVGGVAGEADLGRHRVDLTCLLPLTLEELEDEKSTGKWTTSFRLSGKAKGAILNVSFSFVVVGGAKKGFQSSASAADRGVRDVGVRRVGTAARRGGSRSIDEVRILHEVLPSSRSEVAVASSMAGLREVLPAASKSDVASLMGYELEVEGVLKGELTTSFDGEDVEFTVVEQGVEMGGKGLGRGEDDDFDANDVLMGSAKLREIDKVEEFRMSGNGLPKSQCSSSANDNLMSSIKLHEIDKAEEFGMSGNGSPKSECSSSANDNLMSSSKLHELDKVEGLGMSGNGSPKSECSSNANDIFLGSIKLHEVDKFEGLDISDNGSSKSEYGSSANNNSLGSIKQEMGVVDEDIGLVDEDTGKTHYDSIASDSLSETVNLNEIDKYEGLDIGDKGSSSEVKGHLNADDYMLETVEAGEIDELARMVGQDDACYGQVVDENELQLDKMLEELDCARSSLSVFEGNGVGSPPSLGEGVNYAEVKSDYKKGKAGKSHSFDDAAESVASEFLNLLGVEHSPFNLSSDSDPESPRERLWKQFERESLAAGGGLLGLDIGNSTEQEVFGDSSVHFDFREDLQDEFPLFLEDGEAERHMADNAVKNKTRAEMLEDLETEALMREWGLNEKAFRSSPPDYSGGFGSPINLPPEDPLEPPPLAEGLGSFLQTKDGGFLRSMSPSLFKNAKNNGTLIMQVSNPVVVPAEMGSGVMEILQHLVSVGAEKLSIQANKLMPLEDITGKTMQQVAWEAVPSLEARERMDVPDLLNRDGVSANYAEASSRGKKQRSRSSKITSSLYASDLDSEYVSIEELAPLAMDKIEALSIEGLRIQSGMSDEEAPSNICAQSFGDISALEGIRGKSGGSLGLEGAAGLQLLDIKGDTEDVDGLMSLSLSLDEWMRLDAGMVDEDEKDNNRTSKILAAHHANCTTNDLISGRWKGDKRGERGKKWGLLGNNFTVALMVQLRDPLRNYEPVGTPMLSLIQVERVFVPPKPKIYNSVSENIRSEESDDEPAQPTDAKRDVKKEEPETELIPQFKITDVHVAGIRTEPTKKKLWGSSTQQQSGSRWLLASGMGKSNKHPLMKSKALTKSSQVTVAPQTSTTTVQPGETLWSISSRVHGSGAKWKELAALNPHIRNPNVIFPNQTIKLR